MRIIPIILCTTLVMVTAAPNPGPGSYSANHYQFQRSSSAYRNNELQHKNEEAGAYGRIEDPDKYEKPLEQSHYRQSSYNAPNAEKEDSNEDSSEEKPYSFGIKGGRTNSYGHGHSANYHNRGAGYYGQSSYDTDYTNGDSFYRPGSRYPPNYLPPGSNNPPDNHYGGYRGYHHQERGYHHHGHGYHQQNHGFQVQETSSQASSSISTNQNKDDQLISLDQTFDYSKFKDHGFGKDYLENTEGQTVTTPKTVVQNIPDVRPIFETTADEVIPEQLGISDQMGNANNGQTIQQAQEQEQLTTVQSFQQKEQDMGQTFFEGQATNGQFGSADQMGQVDDNQQQIDIGKSFLEGQTTQQGQTNTGFVSQQGQTNFGQNTETSELGSQDHLKPLFEQIDRIHQMHSRDHTHYGSGTFNYGSHHNHQFQAGNHREIQHHTTGYIKPKYETDYTQQHTGFDEPDCRLCHHKEEGKQEETTQEPVEQMTQEITMQPVEEMTTQQSVEEATTQTSQKEDNNMEMTKEEKQDGKSEGNFQVVTEEPTTTTKYIYQYHQNHEHNYAGGYQRQHNSYGQFDYAGQHRQNQNAYGRIEFDGKDLTQQQENGRSQSALNQQQEDLTQQQENGWSQLGLNQQQEDLTQQQENGWSQLGLNQQQEDLTQQQENGWSQLGFNQQQKDLTQHEDLTQQQEDLTQQHEDLTQQQEDLTQQHEDLTQQHEDLTQQQEDLTQQQQNSWGQIGINHEDLSQKPQKQDEEYGHLEFGGQQQEDLNQKHEEVNGYGNNYGHYNNFQSQSQNKELASEVQDVSQQVQKVHNLDLQQEKETELEPEEIAVVEEEKPTEKPGFWRRIGGSISRTYETAKQKVKNNLG